MEIDVTITTNTPVAAGTNALGAGGDQKDWLDFIGGVLPDLAGAAATTVGIDPRIAGQTMSQVLSIFGIGGKGKAFAAALPKEQALAQAQQVVAPYLSDKAFKTALGAWLQAATEPVQAHKEGKAYHPDLSKSWFDDAVNSIGGAVSSVNWGQVAQVGMQALPFVLAAI
jgi:hypothetical protein